MINIRMGYVCVSVCACQWHNLSLSRSLPLSLCSSLTFLPCSLPSSCCFLHSSLPCVDGYRVCAFVSLQSSPRKLVVRWAESGKQRAARAGGAPMAQTMQAQAAAALNPYVNPFALCMHFFVLLFCFVCFCFLCCSCFFSPYLFILSLFACAHPPMHTSPPHVLMCWLMIVLCFVFQFWER